MTASKKFQRIEMTDEEIESLLHKAGKSPLEPDEVEKLRNLVATLRYVTSELEKKRVSLKRLKRMLFGPQSEKTGNLRLEKLLAQGQEAARALGEQAAGPGETGTGRGAGESDDDKKKPKGHGRRGAEQYSGGEHEHVPHPELKHKSPCPKCQKGKLALQKRPKVLVRLVGSAPVQAKVWTYDWLRCNSCGAIFTAPLPKAAGPPEKFDESVTSTIGLLRYGFGMPFNRLENLQESVSIPLPASTQWDLVNRSASHLVPVFLELIREAATGETFYNDDTTMRILELIEARKKKPPDEKSRGERTGTFTTGVISTVGDRKIALYLTGQNHAGENLEKVLAERSPEQETIVQMSDGLSRNEPKHLPHGLAIIHANCMAHGRRKYVEIADSFPDQCLHVLVELEKVYKNEGKCRREKMTPEERLAYHQENSGPLMDDLEAWLRRQLDEKLVEPNSPFGEATEYMLKRWDRLTRFLSVAGAPIDNNICERALKRAIRHRKNSLFYKTLHGARVGDIYMSLIHTCELNGINPFVYLTRLVREGERIAEDPQRWLPWNFESASSASTPASTCFS
ncbi:IS66 family transposase [Myxococcota bacterium]